MKKILLIILTVFVLTGCSSEEEKNSQLITNQKEEINILENEILDLKSQKELLINEIKDIKVESGTAKYIITLNIKQSHISLDIGKHIKDSMNAIEIQIPVDKEFYDSVEVGDVLDDTFRMGSLLMEGSFGNWKVKVADKEIK